MNSLKNELPISIVIATLGSDVLKNTIAHINEGNAIPAEILICIPETESKNIKWAISISNIHVIELPFRGQVAQRAVGLTKASYPYVMQLDDDVILPPDTVRALYESLIKRGPGNIIAPFFRLQKTGEVCTSNTNNFWSLMRSCFISLVCGVKFGENRSGKISLSGIGFGVQMKTCETNLVESEWLPGGAALCHKADLITYNYYPFSGKAYSEDLIHSILWRRQGCRLWTALDVSAMIDITEELFAWNSVMARYRAHAYVAQMIGGNIWRTRLWFSLYCILNMQKILVHNFLVRHTLIECGD